MEKDYNNTRKGEAVYICDGRNRCVVKCDVTEGSVVKCFVTVPVHGKHGGIALRGI